jgi:RHS repeat-associated protein
MNGLRATTVLAAACALCVLPLIVSGAIATNTARAQTAPPEPPVIDNFNRTDGYINGGGWNAAVDSSPDNLPEILSNQFHCDRSSGALCDAWRTDVRYGLDEDVMVTIPVKPGAGNTVVLYARLQTPASDSVDGYALVYTDLAGTDQIQIDRLDSDALVPLATISQEFVAGDALRVRAVGSTLEAWRRDGSGAWSQVGQTTDATYVGVGYVGVGVNGTIGKLDDFGAATLRDPAADTDPVVDNFNRPDGYINGGGWDAAVNASPDNLLEIMAGQLHCDRSNGALCDAWRTDVRFGLDQEAWATIERKPGLGNTVYLYARLQTPASSSVDGYAVVYTHLTGVDQVAIKRIDADTPVPLATFNQELVQGDKLKIRVVGSSIQALRKDNNTGTWSQLGQVTDATYVGVGYVGVGLNGTIGKLDNFGATTLRDPAADTDPVVDNFNRADGYINGGGWNAAVNSSPDNLLEIVSGQLHCDRTNGALCDAWRTDVQYGVDQEAWATIERKPGLENSVYLYARLQGPGADSVDGYAVVLTHKAGTDQVSIDRMDNYALTALKSVNQEFLQGDKLKIHVAGTSIEAWRRNNDTGTWSSIGQVSDGTYEASGYVGVGLTQTIGKLDNFGAATLSGGSSGPPAEQSYGTGENGYGTHGKCGCATIAEPVNTLTGAFTTKVEDMATPGTGVSFDWGRNYTSADPTIGRLGQGWADTYSASLAIQPNGDALLHGEDGQQLLYTKQQDGSLVGAPGSLSTLSAVAGGYTLLRTDQVAYSFDAQGRLLSMKDRNGQGVTLAYDGQGQLATITDAANRQTTVSYNAQNLVSQVATVGGRSVAYGYTSGQLTSVTDVRGKNWSYTYDGGGRLATIVDPLSHMQVTNVYDANGRVHTQTDALNKTTTFDWDAASEIATVTDANSKVWTHDYDQGILAKETDPLTNATQLGHDADLNETAVTSPANEQTTMTYDPAGNLLTATAPPSLGSAQKTFVYSARNDPTQVTDARNKATSYTYDPSGNTKTVTQEGVLVATYTYFPDGTVQSFTDGNGKTTNYTHDANGNVASVTDALGDKTTYTYDPAGRVATRVDPKGNVAGCNCAAQYTSSYTYNAAGQELTETDPLGHGTTNVYDDAGRLQSTTDANGHVTSYTYDNANRVLAETAPDPDGAGPLAAPVTTYTYDNVGNKLTETAPRGNVAGCNCAAAYTTTYAYDADNRLASQTAPDPDGAGPLPAPVTTYTYDADGNLKTTVGPRGNVPGCNCAANFTTSYGYDAAGRLKTTTDPLQHVTTNHYDAVGNLDSVTDANSHVTSYTYDAAGRVLTITAPDGGATTNTYDPAGNLKTRRDDNQHTTTYAYDDAGRLSSETGPDPDGAGAQTAPVTSYTYDENGNRKTLTDAKGNSTPTAGDGVTTYGYDRANRLTSIDYADATPDVTFTLDDVGNRLTMADGSGTETRTYDNLNRLATVTRVSDTFSYLYDPDSNLMRRTYPGSVVADYSYDPLDRLSSVTSSSLTTSYGYDAASNLTQTTLPSANGYVDTRTYDNAGRLTDVESKKGAATLARFTATLDPVGNPTQVVRTGSLSQTQTYGYDLSDRLTSVCFQAGACPGGSDPFIRWTYDKVGNRKTEQRPGAAAVNYSYDARDRLLSAGSTSYTWDQNGNELSAGTRTFTYDLANRLKTTTQSGTTTTYLYDGDSRRAQASTGTQASKKTNYLWDVASGLPQVALERDGNNSLLRRYLYGIRRISMTTSSSPSYYLYDGLGSVANLTSSSGATQWTWSYEPFSSTRTETKANGTQPDNSMKFTGEYLDPTGLYHLRARQLDGSIGRFLIPDPAPAAAGDEASSTFQYADDRPAAFVDPSGRILQKVRDATLSAAHAASRENIDLFLSPATATDIPDRRMCGAEDAWARYEVSHVYQWGVDIFMSWCWTTQMILSKIGLGEPHGQFAPAGRLEFWRYQTGKAKGWSIEQKLGGKGQDYFSVRLGAHLAQLIEDPVSDFSPYQQVTTCDPVANFSVHAGRRSVRKGLAPNCKKV